MNKASPDERRPSPKALLELAAKEHRGKLKVFLGMAPGVGKTFAMLSAARVLKADGDDVAVGVVETHGRAETAALLEGLEVLPRKPVAYRERTLLELDVEGALARRPKLLLVDEFAHSNAPGLTHVKRYQDVEDLLRAGIDVWTTLNIQHLESLQDVVQRITGVRVQETVPDTVLEAADEVVVVDLPPEDLVQRLKEGKVYLPENARRAIDQFFKPSNLTALRELALRRTADRVDEQMLSQLRQQGIEGPWPTAERILVCVGGDEHAETVVRMAARLATALKADWFALHLTQDREMLDRTTLSRVEQALRLAERLGADTARLAAKDLVEEVLAYARRNNITQIVVGRSRDGLLRRWLGRSLSHDLVAKADGLPVLVVAPKRNVLPRGLSRPPPGALPPPGTVLSAFLSAGLAVGGAVAAGLCLEIVTPVPNLSIFFLLAVLLCALAAGLWPAIVASLLSFLAYNFFFIEPRYSFTVAEPHELLALVIFLVVAIVTGTLAGRLRAQAFALRERAETTEVLLDFSHKLSGTPKLDDVLWLVASQTAATVKGSSVILMGESNGLVIKTGWPPEDDLPTADWAAARWAFSRNEPAGRHTGTLPSARHQFLPVRGAGSVIGVVGLEPRESSGAIPQSTLATIRSLIEQAAVAIERIVLVAKSAQAETAAEGERLRATLLSSISHDLRTPLAAIVGSATGLRTLGDRMSAAERSDLLVTIEEEAGRLSSFVSNLLDMTRLDAGGVEIRSDDIDIGEIVTNAVERARKTFPLRPIDVVLPDRLPAMRGDALLLDQVLFNLFDNAHKYSPAGTATRVEAWAEGGNVMISVSDEGVGIPAEALAKVFDKFYRVASSDGRAAGTGLGLSICAAIVKAMGGRITAESPIRDGKGTRIKILLPIDATSASASRRADESRRP